MHRLPTYSPHIFDETVGLPQLAYACFGANKQLEESHSSVLLWHIVMQIGRHTARFSSPIYRFVMRETYIQKYVFCTCCLYMYIVYSVYICISFIYSIYGKYFYVLPMTIYNLYEITHSSSLS